MAALGTTRIRPTAATRLATLGSIRIAALAVAVGAAVAGAVFAVASLAGPTMFVFSADGSGAGTFVALPPALRVVRVLAVLLPCLTVAVMAALLADLSWRVRREVRFLPALSRTVAALAIVLAAGSWLGQIAANLARYSGLVYPDEGDPASVDLATLPIDWGFGAHTFAPDWAMLGLSVVLAVLAFIIRAGERLQRDTEGLV